MNDNWSNELQVLDRVGPSRDLWEDALARATAPRPRFRTTSARRSVRIAIALVVLAGITTGVAWAAGAFKPSPRELFTANPQGSFGGGFGPERLWHQNVIPDSVKKVASVHIPKVGPVAFWYGHAKQGGWCAGLRLSNGDWLGTDEGHYLHLGNGGRSIGTSGGVVPGCFPSLKAMHKFAKHLYVPNGFACLQNVIDARSVGELWQIRYGLITAPGAVIVRDVLSGKSTNVIDGNFFMLAIRHPPRHVLTMHLMAYDKGRNVVANGRSAFGC